MWTTTTMIKAIFAFALIFMCVVTFQVFWKVLTKSEKWEFTKILFRGIIISMVTLAIMITTVILF